MIEKKTTKYMVFELVQGKPPSRFFGFPPLSAGGSHLGDMVSSWRVTNRSTGSLLGTIEWWFNWKQYCFFPSPNTLFDRGCMNEIVSFINELSQEQISKLGVKNAGK